MNTDDVASTDELPIEPLVATLILDVRERALADALRGLLPDDGAFEIAPLDLGDAHITYGEHRWVFERKTLSDLHASLQDGRYTEQKARLLSHVLPSCVTYVLEGVPSVAAWCGPTAESVQATPSAYKKTSRAPSKAALQGVVLHTMYRDGMHVIQTQNIQETAMVLAAFLAKVRKRPEGVVPSARLRNAGAPNGDPDPSYLSVCRLKAKPIHNVDPPTCWRMMLGQVPGISAKLAEALAARWATMPAFANAMNALGTSQERVAALRQVPLMGPKKAEVLLTYTGYGEAAS